MADNKKSFLIYCDIIHTVDHLTDEEKGKLFQHLLEYVNDMNPTLKDRLLLIAWKPIELQLKRDLKKYESICERNSKNGAKGGRPSKPKKPNGLNGNPKKPKKADTDNDTDTDIDNDTVNDKDINIKVYSKEVNDCFNNCLNYFPEHLQPKNKNSWLDTIEKLNRIDNIPFEIIEEIVKKTREDNFWSKNFLSLNKLRDKNKDGIKYIIVFNEQIKGNGTTKTRKQRFAEAIQKIHDSE